MAARTARAWYRVHRSAPDRNSARLRIIATTDVHVHLMGYDYYADRPDPTLGLAHAATLIAAARSEVANSLLLDNGDFLQGNPMGDYVLGPGLQQGCIHPAVRVMNRLGYDAATLGNHEFNYGLPTLTGMMEGPASHSFPPTSPGPWAHPRPRM
ncbi:metallophosphoesterase [Gemmobacter lanyuensis]